MEWAGSRAAVGHHAVTRSALDARRSRADAEAKGRWLGRQVVLTRSPLDPLSPFAEWPRATYVPDSAAVLHTPHKWGCSTAATRCMSPVSSVNVVSASVLA